MRNYPTPAFYNTVVIIEVLLQRFNCEAASVSNMDIELKRNIDQGKFTSLVEIGSPPSLILKAVKSAFLSFILMHLLS